MSYASRCYQQVPNTLPLMVSMHRAIDEGGGGRLWNSISPHGMIWYVRRNLEYNYKVFRIHLVNL